MGLFKNIRNATIISTSDREFADFLGIDIGDVNVNGVNALSEATVYACTRVLADTVSKLPLQLFSNKDDTTQKVTNGVHKLIKLRPNPYMSAVDFWKCMETQRNIYGNSYAYIDINKKGRNAGKIKGLFPLDASKVQVWIDDEGLIKSENKIWYQVTDNIGNQFILQSHEILHFKGLTHNGLVGLSPIETLKNLVENGKSAQQYVNNFFKNGMSTKGIIQYTGELNKEGKSQFIKSFEEMSNGLKNSHKVSLLPFGYQFQPISLKMTDAQFLENSQLTIQQIASVFGVKAHQINDLSKATFSNISEQQREFYIDTLQAILTMYEQELTYKLLNYREREDGYFFRFNVDAILRSDFKTRMEGYGIAIEKGIMTANECRDKENLVRKEGADELITNGNMQKLKDVGAYYKNNIQGGENGE